jgi:hypothetical protein
MKLDTLKEYIRQEVRNAVREEVKNCLLEAFSKESISRSDSSPSFSSLVSGTACRTITKQKEVCQIH